jgi:hypothetical protein
LSYAPFPAGRRVGENVKPTPPILSFRPPSHKHRRHISLGV